MSREFTLHRNRVGTHSLVWGTAVATTCAFLAACGGGAAKISTAAGQRSAAAPVIATVVKVVSSQYGAILADAKGFVLYTYTADGVGGTGCFGTCLVLWPPLLLPPNVTQPEAGPGVGQLGSVARPEGMQVTYQGQPLYTYLDDRQPGQITGQAVVDSGGTWFLATIQSPTAQPSTTTSSGVPAAHPPVTGPPAAQPPVTPPAATRPPVTSAPGTSPPGTQAPVTSPPPTPAPTTPPTTPPTAPPTTAPAGGPSY